jgi:DNA repair exonuclease SbcCD nuclease subunit
MKFAHLSDTHLGYRQYGLYEREEDFYAVFRDIIDKIIEERADFVIHSGDLFEAPRPSPNSLLVFQEALLKLNEANIPIYAIAGNHDVVMRKNSLPPQILFRNLGLKLISPKKPFFHINNLFIGGTPYLSKIHHDLLVENLQNLSKKSEDYEKSILLIHQGIDKYLPFGYELEIANIPTNFNYYACGHLHNRIQEDFGKGKLAYSGSTEIWKVNEYKDYKKNGKGFFLVDISDANPEIEHINIEPKREFILKNIEYDKLSGELLELERYIGSLKNKPILNVTVENGNFNRADVYEKLNESFGKSTLMLRPNFKVRESKDNERIIISDNDSLNPKSLLIEKLEHFDNEDINNLAIDLMDNLSTDNNVESEKIVNKFFQEYFHRKLID